MAKIAFITSRFPFPLTKGDKLRVYYQLKSLHKNHEIHLFSLSLKKLTTEELNEIYPFCKSIHNFHFPVYRRILSLFFSIFNKMPLQVAWFFNGRIKKEMAKRIAELKPDLVHCHLIRTANYAPQMSATNKSIDFMDAFGLGIQKRLKTENNIFLKLLLNFELKKVLTFEQAVLNQFKKYCIISEQDKVAIDPQNKSQIKIIPNGVDLEKFKSKASTKIFDIAFIGNLSYPPNISAVIFLVKEILPILKKEFPELKIIIAGANATAKVKALENKNVVVKENVPAISEILDQSKMMLAPMQISIGLQNKILEAMAMQIPCVVSKSSNIAINAKEDVEILTAETAEDYALHIGKLLKDENFANEIATAGHLFVKENFSWEKQNKKFEEFLLFKI